MTHCWSVIHTEPVVSPMSSTVSLRRASTLPLSNQPDVGSRGQSTDNRGFALTLGCDIFFKGGWPR